MNWSSGKKFLALCAIFTLPLLFGWVMSSSGQWVSGTPLQGTLTQFPTFIVGVSGTTITNIQVYSQALTPSQMAASIAFAEQTFTVTGLATTDKVYVNPGGAQGAQCAFTGTARVSAANTLALTFFNSAASLCTPAASTYLVVAIRS